MKRYFAYHWLLADERAPAAIEGGVKHFDELAFNKAGADKALGMTELQALQICNLWNQGEHHRYRYWIEV